jgi:CBS domain-containing protein
MISIRCFAKKVFTAGPHDPIASVAQTMASHNVGAVVITEQWRPVGIVTDRDLALALGARGVSPQSAVAGVMSAPVITLHQDEGVFHDTSLSMKEAGVRRLPVVDDDGFLIGIVTVDDLVRVLSREMSSIIEAIKPEMEAR